MKEDVGQTNSIASLVTLAADEFLDQLARGELPEVSEYARRYPQVASVLPQVLPVLEMLQTLVPGASLIDGLLSTPAMLGEFHLLREIGRGGMGVVFEAEQISSGRRVAVKVLAAPSVVDAKQLARFQIETQVAASLDHPHIVPIFAVGCDRGLHYYAMQLIPGRSLAMALRGSDDPIQDPAASTRSECSSRPFEPRQAARLALQAAEALNHAHELGVLHRDVKPANLLVDDHGHLWVTDFGLARFQGGSDLTSSGDLVGTLRYMSPEQAAGGRILDARTDVYSLGASLYELLTARPAFDASDRQALLGQIAFDPPILPSKLNRGIPHDLETICLKAMAKDAEHRYATARALAEDLERFLDDRPIIAQRPGPVERLARWSRRHWRTTIAAAAMLTILALGCSAGMARLWTQQRLTIAALEKAVSARNHERQALIFTFAASDQISSRALAMIATRNTGAEKDRDHAFCRKALEYYKEIAARYDGDPEMHMMAAAAHHRVGFIRTILKDEQAEEPLRRSIAIYEELLARDPGSYEIRTQLAISTGDLALFLRQDRRQDQAIACLRKFVALRQGLADEFPGDTDNLVSLTYHQVDLGNFLVETGDLFESAALKRQLRANYPRALESVPGDHRLRNSLAWLFAGRRSAPEDAIRAVALAEAATSLAPQSGAYWNTLGVARYRAGDRKGAIDALERSMRLRSGGDPYDWFFLAMAQFRLGDTAAARAWYDRSLGWLKANTQDHRELQEFRLEAQELLGLNLPAAVRADGNRPSLK